MASLTDEQLLTNAGRVSGAASGIGRATALLFGKYGAKVVIGDIDISGAATAAEEVIHAGG
ncbi:hypothetical protein EW026_g7967 [Hermanssonia centrifuga]|uniref:SDR family NAD(P)-dependent oxidoreductase n=1 Tax=Hermanssonia centrifuga TaxID=98765 RepID=A0A4S4K608_9APHY|nr:hypothetical protein EW026_g7967 [Hermanssonia centrifuga]